MNILNAKNYSYALVFGIIFFILIAILSGCKCNNPISNIISSEKKENIIIMVDPLIEKDVSERLNGLASENLIKWEIKTESENKDIVITTNKKNIPENWKIEEIYHKDLSLAPDNFSEKFANNFNEGLIIYIGSNKNEMDIIKKTLEESYKNSPPETAKVIFLGDIMLSRTVENKSRKSGNWNWPFLDIKNSIVPTDLTIANLESPFSDPPKPFAHNTVFGADVNMVKGLKDAAIDVVDLANNHFGDSGQKGMNLTFETLKSNDMSFFGAGDNFENSHKPLIKNIKDIKFAFLGYVTQSVTPSSYGSTDSKPGLNFMDIEQMQKDINEAKKEADFIIVSMHAGTEYTPNPSSEQIEFAHKAIEAGADMIYSHHPHVVQAIESYQNKPIFYSLGNFVFDQEWSQETKEGIVLKTEFIYDKITSIELVPIIIENYGQPKIANSKISSNILERIFEASGNLK